MDGFMRALVSVWTDSGFAALTWQNIVMIFVGLILLYLAIAKEYEPLLLRYGPAEGQLSQLRVAGTGQLHQ